MTCICPTTPSRLKYLPRAIRCFQAQTWPNRELLILEDGSAAVRESIPADPRIRYLSIERCKTLGHKRNIACQHAHGEYVAHWDDDDWSAPGRIAEQVAALIASGRAVCGYRSIIFWDEMKQEARRYPGSVQYVPGSTLMFRREWWRSHQFPAMQVGEDWHFLSPATKKRQLIALDNGLAVVATSHDQNSCPRTARAVENWPLISKTEVPRGYFE